MHAGSLSDLRGGIESDELVLGHQRLQEFGAPLANHFYQSFLSLDLQKRGDRWKEKSHVGNLGAAQVISLEG